MYGYGPRRGFGLLGLLFGLVLLGIVAAVAYNVGLSASGAAGTMAAPAVAYPFFWFGGFHLFGLLFFLIIVGLILAAIFRPRGWGHHGWYGGYGRGPWGPGGQEMRDVPPPFEPMLEAWHRRAHGEATTATGGQGEAPERKS